MEHRSFSSDLVVPDDNDACRNKRTGEPAPNVAQGELLKEKQMGGPVNCSDSELSIYLQALEAGFLPTYYLDTSPSVQSKSMSIASRSYQHGRKTVVFHGFPSLQMSRNSTENLGGELLTWFLAGFPAKTSAPPERAEESKTANAPASGWKWPGSSAKYDPASASWKTRQCSLLGDSEEFSGTWPRWGTMRNGECWERQMWERRTSGTEYGLWPTVTVCGNYNRKGASANSGDGLATAVKMWPTPTKSDGEGGPGCSGRAGGLNLRTAVALLPTPTATNTKAVHMRGADKGKARQARSYLPTPTVNDAKNSTLPPSQVEHDNLPGYLLRDGEKSGGQLSPMWVEWLMGWPLGWTDCAVSATGKSHSARLRHG